MLVNPLYQLGETNLSGHLRQIWGDTNVQIIRALSGAPPGVQGELSGAEGGELRLYDVRMTYSLYSMSLSY
jgi:hypothetical protein